MIQNKYIYLTKVVDYTEGNHPNGIDLGYVLHGLVIDFNIGEQLYLYQIINGYHVTSAWTSKVVDFDEETMLLKTENSVYKVDII